MIKNNYNVVNGFGLGVGSAVINGALDAVYSNPKKFSENQLILKPFPQFPSGGKDLGTLWEEYRQNMISRGGVSIILFGNKIEGGNTINAGGVRREFEIAIQHGLVPLPISYTGFMAEELYQEISKNFSQYNLEEEIFNDLTSIILDKDNLAKSVNQIVAIVKKIAK